MSPPNDLGAVVLLALAALEELFEQGEEHPDTAALTCPTMSPEALEILGDFLTMCCSGALLPSQIRNHARMWLEVALCGWPFDSSTALTLLRALRMLAAMTPEGADVDQPDPPAGTPLERAIEAVIADPAARPALWKALWYGTIFLPVADVDFDSDEHAVFRFVTLDIGGEPAILGFTTEERLDLVAPDDEPVGRVEPTGEELARLWPDDHWLILNPGFSVSTVLSPAELKGLPDGPKVFVPDELPYPLEPPATDDPRLAALRDARHTVPGVAELHWAVLRPEPPGRRRDVLVVRPADPQQSQVVLATFSAAASRAGFGSALVVAATPEIEVGLTAQAATVGVAVG